MTDLHCPARILVTHVAGAEARAAGLRGERVAAVWSAPGQGAVSAAVGESLGVPVSNDERLREHGPDESRDGVRQRFRDMVEEVADSFRGETVLVLAPVGIDTGDGLLELDVGA